VAEVGAWPGGACVACAQKGLKALEERAGPLAGQEQQGAFCSGMRLVAIDLMCLDLPDTEENAAEFGYPGNEAARGRSRRPHWMNTSPRAPSVPALAVM
jgi:hypothetical protein